MARTPTIFDYWRNSYEIGMMLFEAQAVIGMRLMGMAGIWSVTPAENGRMVTEKVQALNRSMVDATRLTLRAGTPDRIVKVAVAPYRQRTRSNARRLGKRGLR